jgi:hypothetical protein
MSSADFVQVNGLGVLVPPVGLGDHRAAGHVVGGEPAGGAVPHVIVGHPRGGRGQYRQAGRGPVEGLDLGGRCRWPADEFRACVTSSLAAWYDSPRRSSGGA